MCLNYLCSATSKTNQSIYYNDNIIQTFLIKIIFVNSIIHFKIENNGLLTGLWQNREIFDIFMKSLKFNTGWKYFY